MDLFELKSIREKF